MSRRKRGRSFQSLSVEGVTQFQRFNTQLPHFLWALNFLTFLPRQLWGLGAGAVCASAVITHPLRCFACFTPSLPAEVSPAVLGKSCQKHTKGGSRAPWLCNHRYRGTQQTDSFGQGKLPTPPDLSGSASVICGHILCLDCGRCVTDDSSMFEVQLYPLRFTQDPYHWILCIVFIAQELFSLWNPWLEAQWKGRAVL